MKRGVGFGVCKSLIYIETLNPTAGVFKPDSADWCRVVSGLVGCLKSMGYKAKPDKTRQTRHQTRQAARLSGLSGFPLGNPTPDTPDFSDI